MQSSNENKVMNLQWDAWQPNYDYILHFTHLVAFLHPTWDTVMDYKADLARYGTKANPNYGLSSKEFHQSYSCVYESNTEGQRVMRTENKYG
ncbi:hypothetical protein AVEN_37984-1 [Araneus ventricosus]|uniref:Uncharacterized protein n=1 Tax=Araneus ventricosus TaxID=182803 RepID=A0A4Y2T6X9_ARAVE|nr:hypothetical protein AVEN_37984-1 [Araneus ventricosus]